MILPDDETAPLKIAAFHSGLSVATLRRIVRKHGIARQAKAGAPIEISLPGLAMVRHEDLAALELLKAGRRNDPRVRPYLASNTADPRPSHLTTSAYSSAAPDRGHVPLDRAENEMATTSHFLDGSRVTPSFRQALDETASALGMTAFDYCVLAAATRLAKRGIPFSGVFKAGDFDAARAKVRS